MRLLLRNLAAVSFSSAATLLISVLVQSCAPQPVVYRRPVAPPPDVPPAVKPQPVPAEKAPAPAQETIKKPFPPESEIVEQNLKSESWPAPVEKPEPGIPEKTPQAEAIPPAVIPPLPDDSSLLAKITPNTDPRRAASLRLTDEGRRLLDAGSPARALDRLERTIVIDSTNPYGYFYLAKAQYQLGRYRESLNFLDVAEARLGSGDLFWLAEVHALRGENFKGLGLIERAQNHYLHALSLNSGNRTAAEGLQRVQGESQSASD